MKDARNPTRLVLPGATAVALLLGVAGLAHAETVEDQLKVVDEALQDDAVTEELSRSDLEYAMALRIEGQQHYEANMNAEAEQVLQKAQEVLGLDD